MLKGISFSTSHVTVSAMAGISAEALAPLVTVARRQGATPISPPIPTAKAFFERLGGSIEVADAATFDAISASTATIAARFACLATISRWLASSGLSEAAAARYVASIFAGLASVLDARQDFEHLARDHATLGGSNEFLLNALHQAGVFKAVEVGVEQVLDRLTAQTARPGKRLA